MNANVRMFSSADIIQHQLKRRRETDELAEYAKDHDPMFVFLWMGIALSSWTAVLLAWWYA